MDLFRAVYSRGLKIAAMRALDAGNRIYQPFMTSCRKPFRVHVLYKPPEIPANAVIPEFAISAAYRKKAANTRSIPVSGSSHSFSQTRSLDLSTLQTYFPPARAASLSSSCRKNFCRSAKLTAGSAL